MKTKILIFTIVIALLSLASLSLTSCKSKDEKAAELIKTELSKTLYDFASYEPIETTVTEAYQTAYNDSTCFNMAVALAYGMQKASELLDEATEAKEHAEIWGPPTYYSSTYSDNQFRKYQSEMTKKRDEAFAAIQVVNTMGKALQDSISKLDKSKVIGWDVKHRFRCKTRGGSSTIGDYRYVISPDFKKIIFYEDTDEKIYSTGREIIEMALEHKFDKGILED
ncbi:MAG: hypothetical protein HDS89_02205 [Bacteroidales bacterium]|nr:hypothetical protein [Bacteroidales bacterium]